MLQVCSMLPSKNQQIFIARMVFATSPFRLPACCDRAPPHLEMLLPFSCSYTRRSKQYFPVLSPTALHGLPLESVLECVSARAARARARLSHLTRS